MKARVGAIYSRDRSSSKSHVSSTDKSLDDMFPINKYQMAATSKSVPSSQVVANYLAASDVNGTYSVMQRKQTAFFPESSKNSQHYYNQMMQSIGFGHDSLDNQLPYRNDTFGQPEHSGHTDSLIKYEQHFVRQPLTDKTSRVKDVDNRSRLFRQMSCLQNIFKELNNLKLFEQLHHQVEKIQSQFLRMEKNILKTTECAKSSLNFLSEKSSAI